MRARPNCPAVVSSPRRAPAPSWLLVVVLAALACGGATPEASESAVAGDPPAAEQEPAPPEAETGASPAPVSQALFDAVEREPGDLAARRKLAIALFETGRKQEALEQFERVVAAEPSARHLLDLALCYGSLSRSAEAEATYLRILEQAPAHAVALHNLGNLYLDRGDTARAVEWYRRAIGADPDYLLAWLHLGEALKRSGSHREAYQAFERVLQIEPADPPPALIETYDAALYELAALDLEMGSYERAAKFLEELIRANPEHPQAHYTYGRALTMLGRQEEAQRAFDTHMKLLAARKPEGPVATAGP